MKVTILIPVFNEENTIIEILNRVNSEKKDETEIEIIVVDDCSTDNSKNLLKENTELFDKLVTPFIPIYLNYYQSIIN